MSLHRFVACRRLGLLRRNSGIAVKYSIRWQSSGSLPRRGGSGVLTKVVLGVATTGLAVGGILAYANYNPVFRNQVNERVPGFSSWADKTADLWVEVTDYLTPKFGGSKKKEGGGSLVIEHNLPKIKQRQGEIRDNTDAKKDLQTVTPGSKIPDSKTSDSKTSGSKTPDSKTSGSSKTSGGKTPDSRTPDSKTSGSKTLDSKTPGKDIAEKDVHKLERKVDAQKQEMEVKKKVDSTKMKASSESKVENESKLSKDSNTSKNFTKIKPTSQKDSPSPPSSPVTQVKKSPESVKATSIPISTPLPNIASSPESEALKNEGTVQPEERATKLDQKTIENQIDGTYKQYLFESGKVKDAQEKLLRAWEVLYLEITTPTSDGSQKSQLIKDAKTATSVAHDELKAAVVNYNTTSDRLSELVARAPEYGFMTKATDISSDMAVKRAEMDLGMVVLKEVIASGTVADKYREAIQESGVQLQKDLDAAASLINPERKDSLLLSLNKKVEILDRKLKEADSEHTRKLALALEVQKRSLEELTEVKVEHVLREQEAKYQQQLVTEVSEIAASYNAILREQLRLENESHAHEMDKTLKTQTEQLNTKWASEMDLKLSKQRGFHQIELARIQAKLRGLESMVDEVTSAGKKVLQIQTLHNSCSKLIGTLDQLNSTSDATEHYTLADELESLRKAALGDPFINTILNSIPPEAFGGDGIQSETSIRDRFGKVSRICWRVGLVPESGGGLGTYALSYLRSILTINKWFLGVSDNLDSSKLDTFDLLCHADVRLRKGDLEGAVHYMNMLKGEPRNVAKDWLKDARLYLETRQAVQLIQAYTSANAVNSRQK